METINKNSSITENEIKKNWIDKNSPPEVSICCTTFNHDKYIEKAIDGFLNQKTTFGFEIIIHNDASTDETKNILNKYKEKYPNIIKLIHQEKNIYSKGVKPLLEITIPSSNAKYIAICEGDDYWIDQNKLQDQYNILEENKKFNLCFHDAYTLDNKNQLGNYKIINRNKIWKLSQIIESGGGAIPTASIFLRRSSICNMPDWVKKASIGDYFIQIFSAIEFGALYIDKKYSVYRLTTPGSWSSSLNKIYSKFFPNHIESLTELNNYLDHNFSKEINKEISNTKYSYAKYLIKDRKPLDGLKTFKESLEASRVQSAKKILVIFIELLKLIFNRK